MKQYFVHADLDAFFASVEQLYHPEYRGKPLIIGGLPTDKRSVVSTASYEARKYGIHSAMPLVQALKLCPHGIFIRGDMKLYQEKSAQVMAIFREFSPDVIQLSIDEAFIDLTGTEKLFGDPKDTASRIKQRVIEETGLTVSIGLASTMYLAKIASDFHKPNGFTFIPEGAEEEFMLELPLKKVWGIGEKTLQRLNNAGFSTTRSIHERSENLLVSIFGNSTGTFLYDAVRGGNGITFGEKPKSRSVSSENTFSHDLTTPFVIENALLELSEYVMYRMRTLGLKSRTVGLKIRYEDFTTVSIQSTMETHFKTSESLWEEAVRLFHKKADPNRGIRLLGVSLQNVVDSSEETQGQLFDFGETKKSKVEEAIFRMQKKNPDLKINRARSIVSKDH